MKLSLDALYDRYGFPNEMWFAALRARLRVASVPVRSIYETEVSGINPLTVVPMISLLIARNWWRNRMANPSSARRRPAFEVMKPAR
jgi:hypothetical protein